MKYAIKTLKIELRKCKKCQAGRKVVGGILVSLGYFSEQIEELEKAIKILEEADE